MTIPNQPVRLAIEFAALALVLFVALPVFAQMPPPPIITGVPNWASVFASSNGVPVIVYSSNGTAIVNYIGGSGGGIVP